MILRLREKIGGNFSAVQGLGPELIPLFCFDNLLFVLLAPHRRVLLAE